MRKNKNVYIVVFLVFAVNLALFQNCGQPQVGFIGESKNENLELPPEIGEDPGPVPPVICGLDDCDDAEMSAGLIGELYYLTNDEARNNHGGNAKFSDYKAGHEITDFKLLMLNFDVPSQNFGNGFPISETEVLKNEEGMPIYEWFHLDLKGQISLPEGDYQFASMTDDGIRITMPNELNPVIISNDTNHSPSWDCSDTVIHFNENEEKDIQVEYYQGPATHIALQLFVRKVDPNSVPKCPNSLSADFEIIAAEAFTH